MKLSKRTIIALRKQDAREPTDYDLHAMETGTHIDVWLNNSNLWYARVGTVSLDSYKTRTAAVDALEKWTL